MKTKIAAVVVCILGSILFVIYFLFPDQMRVLEGSFQAIGFSTDLLTYLFIFILAPLAIAGLILHNPKENLPH